MKIVFLVRDDFHSKFGGDTFQIQQYIANMDNINATVITLSSFIFDACYDFYILVNVDRSFDYLWFYKVLKREKILNKTVILPIHHSLVAMELFNRYRFGKLWNIAHYLGGVYFFEKMKGIYRAIKSKDIALIKDLLFTNFKSQIRDSFNRSLCTIGIANGELEIIKKDFSIQHLSNSYVVRNGVTGDYLLDQSQVTVRDIDILVCGRIEERKNQVNIIKALCKVNANVVFIGAMNENNIKYSNEFLELINNATNCTYQGVVKSAEISDYYRRSKVCFSASWFEVSSLVDIEAHMSGCHIFTSKYGNSTEIIPPDAINVVDPSNLELSIPCLNNILEGYSDAIISKVNKELTWKAAGQKLQSIFQELNNEK
jgi:glycosyltransferase involved in cell wall biosynthesis